MLKLIAALISLCLPVLAVAAWITHIVVTIGAHAWVLLAVGAFIFPVGIIHGVMCWFGAGAV